MLKLFVFLIFQAEPLVESLALHELVDPHLGDSFDTHELYLLARVAFLCKKKTRNATIYGRGLYHYHIESNIYSDMLTDSTNITDEKYIGGASP